MAKLYMHNNSLKSKCCPSGAVQSQSFGAVQQLVWVFNLTVGEDGSTGAAAVAMTGPAPAAAGLSRASISLLIL